MYMCKLIILLVTKDILEKVDNGHSLITDEQNMWMMPCIHIISYFGWYQYRSNELCSY